MLVSEASPLLLEAGLEEVEEDGESVSSGGPSARSRRRRLAVLSGLALSMVTLVILGVAAAGGSTTSEVNRPALSRLFAVVGGGEYSGGDVDLGGLLSSVGIASASEYESTPVTAFGSYAFLGYVAESGRLLVEPSKPFVLSLTNTEALDEALGDYSVSWHVVAKHAAEGVSLSLRSSREADLVINAPGRYAIEAEIILEGEPSATVSTSPLLTMSSDEEEQQQGRNPSVVSAFAMCVYVRREVRSLSDVDRGKYTWAIQQMGSLSKLEGVKRYGAAFKTIADLTKVHLLRGANRLSDELHDGVGFLPQHLALSNEFESALQVLDSSIALPYWDFTRDLKKLEEQGFEEGETTEAKAPRFGSLVEANPELWGAGRVFGAIDAQSVHVPQVETDRESFPFVPGSSTNSPVAAVNAYGYMRSPWNLNREPVVTKYASFCGVERPVSDWPSCSDHHAFTFGSNSLHGLLRSAGGHPHGSVHMMLGGASQCGQEVDDLRTAVREEAGAQRRLQPTRTAMQQHARGAWEATTTALTSFSSPSSSSYEDPVDDLIVHIKDALQALWRFHLIEFPQTCDPEAALEDCHAVCEHLPTLTGDEADLEALEWWRANVFDNEKVSSFMPQIAALPRSTIGHAARAICLTPWAFGEQAGAESPLDQSFWPMHPTLDRLLQYKRLVNDFHDLDWDTSPSSLCKYSRTSPCLGHRENDLTSFKSVVLNDDGSYSSKYLTNREVVDFSDPRSYKMKYIYDSFDWSHCGSEDFLAVSSSEQQQQQRHRRRE